MWHSSWWEPAPPGTIVEIRPVFFDGISGPRAADPEWYVVLSRKLLGSHSGKQFYQWYFLVYQSELAGNVLEYESPADGGPLSIVKQQRGSNSWLPRQQLRVISGYDFVQPVLRARSGRRSTRNLEQVVLESHEMTTDCGAGTVTVFGVASSKIEPFVSARNRCELRASIVDGEGGPDTIVLSGPFFGPGAPMCCPTKPHAIATLSYSSGGWIETPNYFPFYVGRLPPN